MKDLLTLFQLILTFGNVVVLAYALYKFLNKPHDTLEEKVTQHDVDIKEIKSSLLQGNDRFREQTNTNEILIRSTLALIEFEIQYCLTENKPMSQELEKTRENLHNYLSRK